MNKSLVAGIVVGGVAVAGAATGLGVQRLLRPTRSST